MLLDKQKVINFLPHRDPFLFIDSVELIENENAKELKELRGSKVVCHFEVLPDHIILSGHFPGNPVLPGVIQVEMMGQASCFGVYYLFKSKELEVKLMGVSNAKFRHPVQPGMKLRIECTCLKARGVFLSYDCRITAEDNQLISQAIILAAINE